jgi:hypothetical protein
LLNNNLLYLSLSNCYTFITSFLNFIVLSYFALINMFFYNYELYLTIEINSLILNVNILMIKKPTRNVL